MNTSFAVCDEDFCELTEANSAKIPLGSYLEFGHVIGTENSEGETVFDINEEGL